MPAAWDEDNPGLTEGQQMEFRGVSSSSCLAQ